MNPEIENCKAETLYLMPRDFQCKSFEDVIFNQLPPNRQKLVDKCGSTQYRTKQSFELMFLQPDFLDFYAKKKKGTPFILTSKYDTLFLKSANMEDDEYKEDITMSIPPEPQKYLPFRWTEPPNNPTAKSIFLYMDPKVERSYPKLMYTCHLPSPPPPTPPEVLAKQKVVIERLEKIQKRYLTIIQTMFTLYKDNKKQQILKRSQLQDNTTYEMVIKTLATYKNKEKQNQQSITLYQSDIYKILQVIKEFDTVKVELEIDTAIFEKYKKNLDIPKDVPPPQLPSSFSEYLNPKTVMKLIQHKLSSKLQSVYKVKKGIDMLFFGVPTNEELLQIKDRIEKNKKKEEIFKKYLDSSKKYILENANKLPSYYTKSSMEEYVEKKLGIPPKDAAILATQKKEWKQKTDNFKKMCQGQQILETKSEEEAYKDVINLTNKANVQTKKLIENIYGTRLTKKQEIQNANLFYIHYMMQFPSPSATAFDEYKEIWSSEYCDSLDYYLPSKTWRKETSFLIPNFESYIHFVMNYRLSAEDYKTKNLTLANFSTRLLHN